jgi:hypothetical protein
MSRLHARRPGALLLVGGALGAAVPVLHPAHDAGYYVHELTAPSHLLLLVAVLLVSLGLPGLVARQPDGVRPLATLGAAGVFVGEWLLDGTHAIVDGAVMPALARGSHAGGVSPHALAARIDAGPLGTLTGIGVPVMIVGCLVLGVALWRGAAFTRVPRWAAVLLACCWTLFPLRFVLPAVAGVDVMLPYVALGVVGAALLHHDARERTPAGSREAGRVAHGVAAA